ncbi:hypothetical protein NDR87_18810 [Nocardia sp. CDC159]|uniref:Uncharacterized protein n=1 Tax=Nocardia pulmonis TaxID=2951408 RepID=A0A9X2IYC9_9NOCA|nr:MULTISPECIES: hypothetical protein [Nocardia]MCM6776258.1 hypothetical protein [Nocardia pulmonis]MCM6788416.1 hypothetical protein [Nocardia sp. CDC159]
MTLDRTGEPRPDHECRRGWLTGPLADEPVPCPICKPHLATRVTTNDYSERTTLSARAQQTIERENQQ